MATAKASTHYIRGKAFYAKVLEPVDKYNKDGVDRGKEWTVDLTPDKEGLELLKKKLKLGGKIKDRDNAQGEYIKLAQAEYRVNRETGEKTKNDPPIIIDAKSQPWDGGKIGNESIVDCKIRVIPYGTQTGVYLQGMRVLNHVPYEGGDDGFQALSPDDEFFAKVEAPEKTNFTKVRGKIEEDLEDEIPF